MRQNPTIHWILIFSAWAVMPIASFAQKPIRTGSTTAAFLETGYGAAGSAMGDAHVSIGGDVSSLYWNPAGLAGMRRSEVMFVSQPWIVGMHMSFAGAGFVIPRVGTVGAGLILMDYGEMEVTTMAMQEGTGESFSAKDIAISLSFARNLAEWFSFGATGKLVTSNIWHMTGTAMAFDLGAIIQTNFLSRRHDNASGMQIGMSISNYGTAMKYDGLDLLNPIDVDPNAAGNLRDAPGQFRLQKWELPLIFRIGASVTAISTDVHELVLAADGLHPNNNSESINLGAQYSMNLPTVGKIFLRGGYKALFMPDSEYGVSFGFGVQTHLLFNRGLKAEYAFRDMGVFGGVNSFGVSVLF
jgi:hypothetical protein